MKKFLSALAAVLVASSLFAASVSATDYTDDPGYDDTDEQIADGTTDIGKTAETPASVVAEGAIAFAVENGEPIYISSTTSVLKADAISAIVNSETPVTFVADGYSITIDPASVTDAADLDLGMTIGTDEELGGITITPAASGEFGLTATITLPAELFADIDLEAAHLFSIAEDGTVTDLGAVTVNEDGTVSVDISAASEFVISDEALATDDADDDDKGENPETGVAGLTTLAVSSVACLAVIAFAAKKRTK